MKKTLVLLLCTVMVLSLFAGCGGKSNAQKAFSVGYAEGIINPEHSVYLQGYNDPKEDRMSTGVGDDLYANCIAMTDESGETIIFIALDILYLYGKHALPIRQSIADATGVKLENIFLHCSHNHSAPSPTDEVYLQLLGSRCVEAAQKAIEDQKPAQMFTTFARPDKPLNCVRHYLLSDGSYSAEGLGSVAKTDIIGHATQADDLLQLIKFTRDGGKDIVLMNWQGHPWNSDGIYPYTYATSNYHGVMRKAVEEKLDCHGVFVLSGSGNMNTHSQIPSENHYKNYMEVGQALADLAVSAAANFQPAQTGKICVETTAMTRLRSNSADYTFEVSGFSFGDVAFANAPFEVFDTNAMAVKENSKFKMTFYASCTNDWQSYLPTPPSWDWENQYEVRVTLFPKGTAEEVETELRAIMDRLFTESGNAETEKPDGYVQTEKAPTTDGVTYTTPGDTSAYTQAQNGFYRFLLKSPTGAWKNILVRDEDLAKEILNQSSVQLLFDYQGVTVGIVK